MFLLSDLENVTIWCTKRAQSDNIYLGDFEHKVYSQNGEDGVIEKIFELIGATDKFYVEFGVENGLECNTRYLREQYQWDGLLMDMSHEDVDRHLYKEFITRENVVHLFEKHNVPQSFDFLSVDIDFNDYWVLKEILKQYVPRVFSVEFNASLGPKSEQVVLYDSTAHWDGTRYFGASIKSFYKLAKAFGYSLVYAEQKGVNLFFIRSEEIKALNTPLLRVGDVSFIYRYPKYGPRFISGKYGPLLCKGHPKGKGFSKRPFVLDEDL